MQRSKHEDTWILKVHVPKEPLTNTILKKSLLDRHACMQRGSLLQPTFAAKSEIAIQLLAAISNYSPVLNRYTPTQASFLGRSPGAR